MAITTSQVIQLTDSVAQACSDFNTNFVTGTASAVTTINTGVGGTGASQTMGRVMVLGDLSSDLALLTPTNTSVSQVAADLTGRRSLNAFYANYYPMLNALDTLVGGLNAYLTTNSLQINAWAALAFNAFAANSVGLGLRTSATIPTSIAAANFFPFVAVDTMWGFTTSGTTTFSANAVGANASTTPFGGGVGTFYIYKNNAAGAVGGQTFTITYTNAAGVAATTTYSTVAGTPSASGTLATGFTLGVAGSAITAVTASGTWSVAEQYTIGIKLVRPSGY